MKHLFLLAFLVTAMSATAQTVEFFTPRTVHITKTAAGTAGKKAESVVVIAKPENVKVSVTQSNGTTTYKSSELTVTITDQKVSFYDKKGALLMTESTAAFTPITEGVDKGAYKVAQGFGVDADEAIYGVGLLQNGKMSQRGENRLMMQSNTEDYAHFYQTVKGYGIYWDNYSPTRITTPEKGVKGEVRLESQVGKQLDYYFLYGGNADGVIKEMRHLTGKSPMLALWTYGFHQSRERYKSSKELLDVVSRYRRLGVPFDGIIQDWQYWGSNYTWNAMEFISEDFSNAQQMIDQVHKLNAHMSISIWASFGPYTKPYKQLKEKGLLFSFETWPQSGLSFWPPRMDYPSGVVCYKPYSKEARDIYWQNLTRLDNMNIDGWWMDSTDPDHHSYKESDLDEMTEMGSFRAVRNIFPLMSVEGVYDNQMTSERKKAEGAQRPFILTRSYFAGQQRTGANTWTGDVTSSWETLKAQVPICLNYTLTANPQVNTDIGGFFASRYNNKGGNSATYNPDYQELYTRWMQFGAFCPMMRSHGTEVYRELYYFGENGIKGDIENPQGPIYDALLKAVRMRYQFMPYIYSQAWQVSKNDDSFMRALVMDFKADKNTWDNNREYMFGRNVLVCPVVDPLYTADKHANIDWKAKKDFGVYLPEGAVWYDFWTGKTVASGKQTAQIGIDQLPLFIKGGSILPLCTKPVQYASVADWQELQINVYPGADGSFTLYEDEGDNLNYENGAYSTIPFTWSDKSRTLTIGKRTGSFNGMHQSRTFIITFPDGTTKTVQYSGKQLKVKK